ncbi:MAG: hypothetical protein J6X57_06340 [Bacteroidales bacterium]|nr:hypothetical protein [Bacteroidales bacterium]
MKRLCIVIALLLALCSCSSKKGGLYKEAVKVFPQRLEAAMAEYMETVDAPEITGLEPIYDCDSLCVLQCKATGTDIHGKKRSDTVRYIFIKDNMLSAFYNRPIYLDHITGGKYLNKQEKKEYRDKIIANGTKQYSYFLGTCEPIDR